MEESRKFSLDELLKIRISVNPSFSFFSSFTHVHVRSGDVWKVEIEQHAHASGNQNFEGSIAQ